MPRLALALTLLLVAQAAAFAAPTGRWVTSFQGRTEVLTLTDTAFDAMISGPGLPEGGFPEDPGPLAGAEGNRVVIGPAAGREEPFELVWIETLTPDSIRVYRHGLRFASLEQALAAPFETSDPARRYWSPARYEALNALPSLPAPDREAVVALLREVVPRIPPGSGRAGIDETMQDVVAEKGWNPFTIDEVLGRAMGALGPDPEVSGLMGQAVERASRR